MAVTGRIVRGSSDAEARTQGEGSAPLGVVLGKKRLVDTFTSN